MFAVYNAIVTLGFAYRMYVKAERQGKWSNRVFLLTLLGAFGLGVGIIASLLVIMNAPRVAQASGLLALAVAYVALLVALIMGSNRAYRREMAVRSQKLVAAPHA